MVCLVFLHSCINDRKQEIVNEIEFNIKMKLPEKIIIISNEKDVAIGDYTSISKFKIIDKSSLKAFIREIRNSKEYIGKFPGSIPHGTAYCFWYRDNQKYLFQYNGNGTKLISFSLDSITGTAQFCLHED